MIAEVLSDASERMAKAVEVAKEDFSSVRTGRANPAMFQKVMVTYYGSPTPLAQLASMQNPEARTLLITPFDKTALRDIEQAIRDVPNLDANPTNDGNVIRVTMPELTEERRKEYVKIVKTKAEDAKVSLRNIRRSAKDGIDAFKGELGDDERARGEKELEVITKKYVDAIDEALKHKEAELLKV
ncbi:MAG: ribosome recycling factor [Aurantimicrobium sp.]|uniref:Ribosome-recycling factor n=1 Tax=Aurantimicrobium photophilum TaxID=1987356 RepID=A0A2Z3RY54_9MICO|nr:MULTISPECIES: ribosome recycling factor [Aurantimicrobium]MBU6265149.1 ribosome recycling factor [Actinomycetales bacterium]AWR21699.1 Ribosome-recycling factor [Aurantimicrobium photophilum]MDF9810202.1 ribosome recycling factor [Aurantimicrobium minutum]MDH6206936.1 ribosome recycling factor [Aurantimicrobium minutum]MDH6255668.1 ribosome recycling factor [Aurantimicrobium minutum]